MTAVWDTAPYTAVDVDEVLEARTASIIRAMKLRRHS
jgi:hypothetical protein